MRYYLQLVLLALAALYACKRGGSDERLGAAIMVAMFAASPLYVLALGTGGQFEKVDPGYLTIDTVSFALFASLALKSDRWWPLWMASAQLIAVLSHLVRLLDAAYAPFAYALMMRAPSWLEIVILITGTRHHLRRPGRTF